MHEQTAALSEVESEELMGERGIFKQPCQCFPFELNESKAAGPVDGFSSLTMLQNHIFTAAFLQKLSRRGSLFLAGSRLASHLELQTKMFKFLLNKLYGHLIN